MLYKDIPYHHVYMVCEQKIKTNYYLENGYEIRTYKDGMMDDWCSIQLACGHVETRQQAEDVFKKEFMTDPELMNTNLLFVHDGSGEAVGTVALWKGTIQNTTMPRIHWLGVKDSCSGHGLAKYLVQEACRLSDKCMYLSTQTWSLPAIHIYEAAGFHSWNPYQDADYETAWTLIHDLLSNKHLNK